MSVDRSTRNVVAAFFLIAALFLAINKVVESAALPDWWLPILLFVIGAALALVPNWSFARGQVEPEPEPGKVAPPSAPALPTPEIRTYHVTAQQVPRLQTMTIRPDPESAEYTVVNITEDTPNEEAVLPFTETEVVTPTGTEASPEVSAEAVKEAGDDLTRLNGIGPKSSAALIAAGIDSYQKLADSSDEAIRDALLTAKVRLVGDVVTWSQQAAYAAKGDWEGLRNFNEERKSANGD